MKKTPVQIKISAKRLFGFLFTATLLATSVAQAQILVEDRVRPGEMYAEGPSHKGESEAREYFQERTLKLGRTPDAESSGDHLMAIQYGTYLSDKQYRWGGAKRSEDVGESIFTVTYRMGEWVNSMDLFFRGEYLSYDIDNERTKKLSFMPLISFPDGRSGFPVYFGAGMGLGIFLDQVREESDLSFDYQLVTGLRILNIIKNMGLNFETGIKGHVHLLSSGQFNGVFLTVGTVFQF